MQTSQQLQYELQKARLQEEMEDPKRTKATNTRTFEMWKRSGDTAFKAVRYEEAIHAYSMALIVRADPVTLANRSLAYFKTEAYTAALEDGRTSVALDAAYTKGYYRIGVCEFALHNYEKAVDAFTKVLQLAPGESGARQQLVAARKALRDQQFANALSDDDESSASSAPVNIHSIFGVMNGPRYGQNSLPIVFERLKWNLPVGPMWTGPNFDTTIDYMDERIYMDGTVPVQIEAPRSIRKITSDKYTLEFVQASVAWFASDRSRDYPKIFVNHILRDFTLMMKRLPTVVDYKIPTIDDIDCTEEQARLYQQGIWSDCESDGEEEGDKGQEKTKEEEEDKGKEDKGKDAVETEKEKDGEKDKVAKDQNEDNGKEADKKSADEQKASSENDVKSSESSPSTTSMSQEAAATTNEKAAVAGDKQEDAVGTEKSAMDDNSPSQQPPTDAQTPPSMCDQTPPQTSGDRDVSPMEDDDENTSGNVKMASTTMEDKAVPTEPAAPVTRKRRPKPDPLRSVYKAGKLNVCGDTHGQFWDLLNIFKLCGEPGPLNPYLFNGDYVDRGSFGYELVLTLMLWKLHCPLAMHLTRGNHETINMNRSFGFYGEVIHKADSSIFDCFTQAFNALPLAYVLGSKVFILHGGLFSDESSLADVRNIERFRQPPEHGGLMVDCLWSDPHPFFKGRRASVRGAGCQFGSDITKSWLQKNGLELIVRSHEMKHNGYEITHDGNLVTIFSAPNYCLAEGSVVNLTNGTAVQIQQFSQEDSTSLLSYLPLTQTTQSQTTHQWHRLNQGLKNVVDVVLADGSVVTCTPDHQFATTAATFDTTTTTPLDTFTTATDLIVGTHHVVQTVKGIDITQDFALEGSVVDHNGEFCEEIDSNFSLQTTSHSTPLSSLNSSQRPALSAYCRLLGLAWAQRQEAGQAADGQIRLWARSELDAQCIQSDLQTAFQLDFTPKITQITSTTSTHPLSANTDADAAADQRFCLEHPIADFVTEVDENFAPSFLSQPHTPIPFIREFLAAYLGQNAVAPEYQPELQAFSTIGFEHQRDQQRELFVAKLIQAVASHKTSQLTQNSLASVQLDTELEEIIYSQIGFRYTAEKLSKLAVAVTWSRIQKQQTQQQQQQHITIDQFFNTIRHSPSGYSTWSLPVSQVIDREEVCETFDLQVANTHLFVANGSVVHNCDSMGNKGAVMIFDSNYRYTFTQFEAVNHPPVRAMFYAEPYLR